MSPSGGLTCREVVELVTEYLEGSLADADRLRFEDHLAVCPGCVTYVEQMRQTIAIVGQLTEEAIPADAEQALRRAFHDWKARRGESQP